MKELLEKMSRMEQEMEELETHADYWMADEHFDEEKADEYERRADEIYERLYRLFDQAAENIVRITSGQIDKVMAMTMIRSRRSEVERIFA